MLERSAERRKSRLLSSQILPALDDHVAVSWIELQAEAHAVRQLSCDQSGAAAEEGVVYQFAAQCAEPRTAYQQGSCIQW